MMDVGRMREVRIVSVVESLSGSLKSTSAWLVVREVCECSGRGGMDSAGRLLGESRGWWCLEITCWGAVVLGGKVMKWHARPVFCLRSVATAVENGWWVHSC